MTKKPNLFTHASELITGQGLVLKDGRHPVEADLGVIKDGALVHDGQKIVWVGKTDDLPKEHRHLPETNLGQKQALIPGLVDCHTHLVFAGDRAQDFARRCGGETYEAIAQDGGGIQRTVQSTRNATEAELFNLGIKRLEESYRHGVRTIEIKSGYGLDFESELKTLKVIQRLALAKPEMTLVPTFLGAHDFPKDLNRDQYLALLTKKMLPEVAKQGLAQVCDVFIDQGFYTVAEGREILEAAQKLGMKTKIHADELANTESASLAVELGSLSADHLLKVSESGIQKLAKSQTTAVLLPGTAFYLKAPHAPARKLIDAGARVAISTDFNPGTCPTLNLPTILTISALYLGMTRAELFTAVTYNAACALGLQKTKGTLEVGKDADCTVIPYSRFEELYYHFAW